MILSKGGQGFRSCHQNRGSKKYGLVKGQKAIVLELNSILTPTTQSIVIIFIPLYRFLTFAERLRALTIGGRGVKDMAPPQFEK